MRILVVEDHSDTLDSMTRLLTGWGFEVTSAGTLEHGLSRLGDDNFDVIISDIGLPDGTGYALIGEARRRGKDVLAIALSGYDYPSEVDISKLTGFDHHLRKPCNCEELRALLEQTGPKQSSTGTTLA